MIQSALGKLGFDWQVAIANLINFLIIYFLLKKFVFDKLADAILERKTKAEGNVILRNSLDEEKKSFDELKKSKEQGLKRERDLMLASANKEKKDILEVADKEAKAVHQKAILEAKDEKQKIVESVSEDIKDLSISLSQKVLAAYQENPDVEKLKSILDNPGK